MPAGKRNALLYLCNRRSCSPVQLASCLQAPLWNQPEDSSSRSPGIPFDLLVFSFVLKQYLGKLNHILKATHHHIPGTVYRLLLWEESGSPLHFTFKNDIFAQSSHETAKHVDVSQQPPGVAEPGLPEGRALSPAAMLLHAGKWELPDVWPSWSFRARWAFEISRLFAEDLRGKHQLLLGLPQFSMSWFHTNKCGSARVSGFSARSIFK